MDKKWKDTNGKVHSGTCLGSKDEYNVIKCSACGFKHVIPIPTEEFLSNYYTEDFVKNRPKGFYKKIEEDVPWWEIIYNEKYDLLEKYITKQNKSILDIGSGLGYFLKCGKERGWKTVGVEPSLESFDYSMKHGLEIINEYLDEKNYQKLGKYDVVHMHEVIEHLPDPVSMINLGMGMLNPGGLLCIVSPNDFNPLQEAFMKSGKTDQWWISPPEHINYFNFSSISKLLKENGFNILEQTSTFPLELFLLMGDNYIGNSKIGKEIHSKRKQFEMTMYKTGNEEIRRKLYKNISDLGLGRELIIIGQANI